LTPAIPILSLAGNYRVSLRPSPSCAGKLPPDLRVRQYSAAITQSGSRLTIVLGGADFATLPGQVVNRFEGRSKANAVELQVGTFDYYYYYYQSFGFVERLARPPVAQWGFSQTSYLAVTGNAA